MRDEGQRTKDGGGRVCAVVWRTLVPRPASLVLLLTLASCDEAPVGPDPGLVDALAELHLADAVAEADSLGAAAARALRREALAAHGLDSAALADRLRALAREPDALGALYDSVALRLTLERQGIDRTARAATDAAEQK